ncbi:hypothetical protein OAG01_00345 [bacterium]|nr:hypothetical protein [bacterium]MDA7668809.1 hypothetical protein [bacterium]MDB4632875.1 hypothetical protein [bacterium]
MGNLLVAVGLIAALVFGAMVYLVDDAEEKKKLGEESILDGMAEGIAEAAVQFKGLSILLNARRTVIDIGGLSYYKVEFNAREYDDASVLTIRIRDPVTEEVFAEESARIGDLRNSPGSPGATILVGPFFSSIGEKILSSDESWIEYRMN